jgi:hypothetical protein
MSLYRFERTSGLPHGTFGPTREQRMSRRAWVSCAWLALAIALGILL